MKVKKRIINDNNANTNEEQDNHELSEDEIE